MIEMARRLALFAYRILPKLHMAVLWGWPDYEDSVVALERELQDSSVRRVVLLLTDRSRQPPEDLGPKTWRVKKNSPAGLLLFLLSRYAFFTHPCFVWTYPSNVVSVNVWHGMPIKRIGRMVDGGRAITSRYTLATAPVWADVMEEAMDPQQRPLVTGLPRNDRLFGNPEDVRVALGVPEGTQRVVLWLPTYRRSVLGNDLRVDGRPGDSVLGLDGVDPARLNGLLRDHGSVAIVKAHPMAEPPGDPSLSNLWIVDDVWLRRRRLTLYAALAASDVLISDYSSVLVDYLLLDRPVIHVIPDAEEYAATRGFSLGPMDDYLLGPVATSVVELEQCLSSVLSGEDTHAASRRAVREMFHSNADALSTRRLLVEIGLGEEDS